MARQMDVQIKRALAHPRRLEIFGYLVQKMGAGERGASEFELAVALGMAGAKVKYHLTVLRDADLISHTDDFIPGAPDRYMAVVPAGK
jgi:DNA-binding transcriptional ArsR family regulator